MDEYRVHARDDRGTSVYLALDGDAPRWTPNWRDGTTSDDEDTMRELLADALAKAPVLARGLSREPRIVNRGKWPTNPKEVAA